MIVGQQCPPMLKGLCNPAQGRPVLGQRGDGPTLGHRAKSSLTLKAAESYHRAATRWSANGSLRLEVTVDFPLDLGSFLLRATLVEEATDYSPITPHVMIAGEFNTGTPVWV